MTNSLLDPALFDLAPTSPQADPTADTVDYGRLQALLQALALVPPAATKGGGAAPLTMRDAVLYLLAGVPLPGAARPNWPASGAPQPAYYDDRQGFPGAFRFPHQLDYLADPNMDTFAGGGFQRLIDPRMQMGPPRQPLALKEWRTPRNDPNLVRPGWRDAADD